MEKSACKSVYRTLENVWKQYGLVCVTRGISEVWCVPAWCLCTDMSFANHFIIPDLLSTLHYTSLCWYTGMGQILLHYITDISFLLHIELCTIKTTQGYVKEITNFWYPVIVEIKNIIVLNFWSSSISIQVCMILLLCRWFMSIYNNIKFINHSWIWVTGLVKYFAHLNHNFFVASLEARGKLW